jgi:recombinational DNA repair protein RecR
MFYETVGTGLLGMMLYEPTCEVCGSHIEDDRCEVCEHTGDNGDWVEEVIKEKDDKSSK